MADEKIDYSQWVEHGKGAKKGHPKFGKTENRMNIYRFTEGANAWLRGEVNHEKAAEIAGVSQVTFSKYLAKVLRGEELSHRYIDWSKPDDFGENT